MFKTSEFYNILEWCRNWDIIEEYYDTQSISPEQNLELHSLVLSWIEEGLNEYQTDYPDEIVLRRVPRDCFIRNMSEFMYEADDERKSRLAFFRNTLWKILEDKEHKYNLLVNMCSSYTNRNGDKAAYYAGKFGGYTEENLVELNEFIERWSKE